jgi:hypothetical protein
MKVATDNTEKRGVTCSEIGGTELFVLEVGLGGEERQGKSGLARVGGAKWRTMGEEVWAGKCGRGILGGGSGRRSLRGEARSGKYGLSGWEWNLSFPPIHHEHGTGSLFGLQENTAYNRPTGFQL